MLPFPLKKQNKTVDFPTALSRTADFESASSANVPVDHSNIRSPKLGKAVLCMVAGHLRVQNGYWQMILSYKDSTGKRRTKSVTTHLKEKGNKRRAEEMLLDLRRAFTKERQHALQHGPMFSDFMRDWLAQICATVAPTTFASYCRVVERSIIPYFEERQIALRDLTTGDITNY